MSGRWWPHLDGIGSSRVRLAQSVRRHFWQMPPVYLRLCSHPSVHLFQSVSKGGRGHEGERDARLKS